jgi:hypothetical protein
MYELADQLLAFEKHFKAPHAFRLAIHLHLTSMGLGLHQAVRPASPIPDGRVTYELTGAITVSTRERLLADISHRCLVSRSDLHHRCTLNNY